MGNGSQTFCRGQNSAFVLAAWDSPPPSASKYASKQAELPHCAHIGSSDNHCNIIVPAGALDYNLHISDGAVYLVIITKQYG
jgi:hypothetical protein